MSEKTRSYTAERDQKEMSDIIFVNATFKMSLLYYTAKYLSERIY